MLSDAVDFFTNECDLKERCKILSNEYDEALSWELISVSKYSPCAVDSKEFVVRQIFSPIHIDNDEIKVAAFDDASNKGLSLNRILYSGEEEIHALGEAKAERDRSVRPDRKYIGFTKACVLNIRECVEGEKRVFAVFDTGLEDVSDHCDLFMLLLGSSTEGLSPKAAKKERRLKLKIMFDNLVASG